MEDLGIHQRHKISSESLKGPAGIALPSGGDAHWFLVSSFGFDDVTLIRSSKSVRKQNFVNVS